jgi:hypothetical protein
MLSACPRASFPVFAIGCSNEAGLPLTMALARSFFAKMT